MMVAVSTYNQNSKHYHSTNCSHKKQSNTGNTFCNAHTYTGRDFYIYIYTHTDTCTTTLHVHAHAHTHFREIAPPLSPGWPQEVCVQISGKEFLAFPSPSKLQQLGSNRVESVKEAIGVSDLYTLPPQAWSLFFSSGVRVYRLFLPAGGIFCFEQDWVICVQVKSNIKWTMSCSYLQRKVSISQVCVCVFK